MVEQQLVRHQSRIQSTIALNAKKLRKIGFAVEVGWLELCLGEVNHAVDTEKLHTICS